MLRVEPDQLSRLVELEDDIHRRIALATTRRWLGEVAGLQTTLVHLAQKKAQVARLTRSTAVPVILETRRSDVGGSPSEPRRPPAPAIKDPGRHSP